MSERPSDRGPSPDPSHDGRYPASRERASLLSNPVSSAQSSASVTNSTTPNLPQRQDSREHLFELPRLPPPSSIGSGSFSTPTTRIGGVSSILNPATSDEAQPSRIRKASYLESPASSVQSLPPITSGQTITSAFDQRQQSPSSQYGAPGEPAPRRILTPRSPSLRHAASMGQLHQPTGNLSTLNNPYPLSPRGRAYAVEPGTSNAPPLPTPPAGARSGYGFSAPTPPVEAARVAGATTTRPRQLSSSASPSTSYSSHTGQTSPAPRYDPAQFASESGLYTSRGDPSKTSAATTAGAEHSRQIGIPISASGSQNVYQMMTLETASGTVQLPVDVHQASKVADEKRRRNAGASARFRQRRKEKEVEASKRIAELEHEARVLTDDVAFYRNEREHLMRILRQMPGGERHLARPPSPRHRRVPPPPLSMQGDPESMAYDYPSGPDRDPRSPEEGRNVRRRTSTYSLPPPPQQQSVLPPPSAISAQPNFSRMSAQQLPSAGPLTSPHPREPLPPPSFFARPPDLPQHQHGPPAVMQAHHQSGPYNPYAGERKSSGPPYPKREW